MAIVRIGERGAGEREGEGDVVDSLLACHRRIRSFLELAARVGRGGDPAEQVAEACGQIARYFQEALPLHVADEEESILPRLSGRTGEVDRALAAMREQHAEHEPHLAELLAALAEPSAPGRIAAAGAALAAAFTPHLELEEAVLFPAIRQLLSPRELAELAAEIRARRR